jgi:hypothetical protein
VQREYKTEQATGIESETRLDKRDFGKRSDSGNAAYGQPVFEIKKSSITNSMTGGKLKTFDIGIIESESQIVSPFNARNDPRSI